MMKMAKALLLILITVPLVAHERQQNAHAVLPAPTTEQQKLVTAALKEVTKAQADNIKAQADAKVADARERGAWIVLSSIVDDIQKDLKLDSAKWEAYLEQGTLKFREHKPPEKEAPK